jgi:hypothetical protein
MISRKYSKAVLGVTKSEAPFLALDKTRTETEKQDWAADADTAEGD